MACTWDKANANAAGLRTTQYLEMFGSHAIYDNGSAASAPPISPPWDFSWKLPATDVMNAFIASRG